MKKQLKEFTYLNRKFKPLGNLPKNFDFFKVTRKCQSIGINNYNSGKYSHQEFYQNAKKVSADKIDIFLMDDKTVVLPCENELFEYRGEFKNISKLENG